MTHPLVSVILTAYNAERFLRPAIDSVLQQTYQDFELILVNDGSTDDTQTVMDAYDDPRIIRIHNAVNEHISASTNKGLSAARGKYIAILDADDLWLSEKMEKQVAYMEEHPEIGACFTWLKMIDESGREWTEEEEPQIGLYKQENRPRYAWLKRLLLEGNCLGHDTVLYRKTVLDQCGPYDPSLSMLLDYEIYLRLLQHADIHIIKEPLLLYRRLSQGESNSSRSVVSYRLSQTEFSMIVFSYIQCMPFGLFGQVFGSSHFSEEPSEALLPLEKGWILYSQYKNNTIRKMGLSQLRACLLDPAIASKVQKNALSPAQFRALVRQEEETGAARDPLSAKNGKPPLSFAERVHLNLWTLKCILTKGPRKAIFYRRKYWQDRHMTAIVQANEH